MCWPESELISSVCLRHTYKTKKFKTSLKSNTSIVCIALLSNRNYSTTLLRLHTFESLPVYMLKHKPRELNNCKIIRQQQQQQQHDNNNKPLSSCYGHCSWLHWSSLQSRPRLPRAGHPSPPGFRRSARSAASSASWRSASSSSSSARPGRWPCSSSVWPRTPASAAGSSCAGPVWCGTAWCRSPCGTAGASVHSGARECPGPCGGAAPDSPGTDMGWARTCTSSCGSTASRGERFLCNRGSRFYTVDGKERREYTLLHTGKQFLQQDISTRTHFDLQASDRFTQLEHDEDQARVHMLPAAGTGFLPAKDKQQSAWLISNFI